MLNKHITFNKIDQICKINFNPEFPRIIFETIVFEGKEASWGIGLKLLITHTYIGGEEVDREAMVFDNGVSNPNTDLINSYIEEYSNSNLLSVSLKLLSDKKCRNIFELKVRYIQVDDRISIRGLVKGFYDHLKDRRNTRILFSAPFGQGKSTFIDLFFEEKATEFEVFKVYPVNYSVASNQDIFRYIKIDILFQLLGKDVEFYKSEIDFPQAANEFIFLNPKLAIGTFLKMVMSLNKLGADVTKSVQHLKKLLDNIETYRKKVTTNDMEDTQKYILEEYEREGSIFEDNAYTQIIRQLLEQLHCESDETKQNVLIIEDLDRIDPEHIFRILNVISAHYDTYKFNGANEQHNKFGFDKIIVVCDTENIRSVFHHRYGDRADFAGYFNKFYSSRPFVFSNSDLIKSLIKDSSGSAMSSVNVEDQRNEALVFILELLISGKQLSLRELFRMDLGTFDNYDKDVRLLNSYSNQYLETIYVKPIIFLIDRIGLSVLNKKIDTLLQDGVNPLPNHLVSVHSRNLLFILGLPDKFEVKKRIFQVNRGNVTFQFNLEVTKDQILSYNCKDIPNNGIGSLLDSFHSDIDSFYEILKKVVKKVNLMVLK